MKFVKCFVAAFVLYTAVLTTHAAPRVVCYFTNWSYYRSGIGKFSPSNIDKNLCTNIVYSFSILNSDQLIIQMQDPNVDVTQKFYQQVTAFKKNGIKVSLALGGWSDSVGDKYSRLLNNAAARKNFITNAVKFIQANNFDGLDLDLEYPGCWQGACKNGSPDKAGFAQLIQELSAVFKPKGWLLSAAVGASNSIIDTAYDVPKLAKYLDWIGVMAYDYHSYGDGQTGTNAPLYKIPGDLNGNTNNIDFSVNYFIKKGAPAEKIILGIPTYGRSFTLANPQKNGVGATASGAGQAGTFTKEPGMLAFYEICANTKKNGWTVKRVSGYVPYAYKGNQWVSYDDVDTIRQKMKYVKSKKLGGAMIWSFDTDDFTNSCGCGKYPLLTALNQELRGVGSTVAKCT